MPLWLKSAINWWPPAHSGKQFCTPLVLLRKAHLCVNLSGPTSVAKNSMTSVLTLSMPTRSFLSRLSWALSIKSKISCNLWMRRQSTRLLRILEKLLTVAAKTWRKPCKPSKTSPKISLNWSRSSKIASVNTPRRKKLSRDKSLRSRMKSAKRSRLRKST